MDSSYYKKIAAELDAMADYLEDCDERLADEIGAKDGISGRIFRAIPELRSLGSEARKLAER